MAKLTNAQKTLVDLIVSGSSYEEAHAEAYPNSVNWTRRARQNNAVKLLKKSVVREYYDAQKKEIDAKKAELAREKALWSFDQSVGTLKFVIAAAVDDAKFIKAQRDEGLTNERVMTAHTANAITHAVAELNKLFGVCDEINKQKETDKIVFINDYEVYDE